MTTTAVFAARSWGADILHPGRPFADLPPAEDFAAFTAFIRQDMIGSDAVLKTPYGDKRLLYADSTASGRSMRSIEEMIMKHVLPFYANTHSAASSCGRQTTQYVEEARQLVKDCTNATDLDAVIFSGHGCTAAIHKFVSIFKQRLYSGKVHSNIKYKCTYPGCSRVFDDQHAVVLHSRTHKDGEASGYAFERVTEESEQGLVPFHDSQDVVVFIGPMEHHSNILPWREMPEAQVVTVPAGPDGLVDQKSLRAVLEEHKNAKTKIASFVAGSNATGLVEKIDEITALVHEYDCLACWDYAGAAPHIKVDMNPKRPGIPPHLIAKDAVFLSPHKLVGGPGTPGVLIVKRDLLGNHSPSIPGGGTVFYVSRTFHRYIEDPEQREEGGTNDIVGAIRTGLAFQLQASAGYERMRKRELAIAARVKHALVSHPNIELLGNPDTERLPIFSFMVRCPNTTKYLHWAFVTVLLNDLFGIQCRGGCVCAAPYGHDLLSISEDKARILEEKLIEKCEILRPGFVRLSMPYYWSDDDVEAVLDCLRFIGDYGAYFLKDYNFYVDHGEYRHKTLRKTSPHRKWLHDFSYVHNRLEETGTMLRTDCLKDSRCVETLRESLEKAHALLPELQRRPTKDVNSNMLLGLAPEESYLRWFACVEEVELMNAAPSSSSSRPKRDENLPSGVIRLLEDEETEEYAQSCPLVAWHQQSQNSDTDPGTISAKPIQLSASQNNDPLKERQGEDAQKRQDQETKEKRQQQRQEEKEEEQKQKQEQEQLQKERPQPPNQQKGQKEPTQKPQQQDKHDEHRDEHEHEHEHEHEPRFKRSKQSSDSPPRDKAKPTLWPKVPKSLLRPIGEAIRQFSMIQPGDRVLLGLSGGKDSLTLLHCLHTLQQRAPIRFELAAVTMNPSFPGYDPTPLIDYMKALDIPYFFEKQDLLKLAKENRPSSICSWCSRMKRGILYTVARREGYNVLALGQHLDDMAETFVMSAFHNGKLRTMQAHYLNDSGDIRIIRPLAFVRERQTRSFAVSNSLPIIQENCPACFEEPQERYRVKTLLAQQEHVHEHLLSNMRKTLMPLMSKGLEEAKKKAEASSNKHPDAIKNKSSHPASSQPDSSPEPNSNETPCEEA